MGKRGRKNRGKERWEGRGEEERGKGEKGKWREEGLHHGCWGDGRPWSRSSLCIRVKFMGAKSIYVCPVDRWFAVEDMLVVAIKSEAALIAHKVSRI